MSKNNLGIISSPSEIQTIDNLELMRQMKIYTMNKIIVGWNIDADLEVLPYLQNYALGIQDCMIRFSRVANSCFDTKHNDRPFIDLQKAATKIGRSDELDWHNALSDAIMVSFLWNHCDRHNFPRDYLMCLEIENNLNNPKPQQLYLELTKDEMEFNHQVRLDHYRQRQKFRKPYPPYKSLEGYSDQKWIYLNEKHKSLDHVFLDIESFPKNGLWVPREVALIDGCSGETLIHVYVEH